MPARLSPPVFEIGDRRLHGSDSGAAPRQGRCLESLREGGAQKDPRVAGGNRLPASRAGVQSNRIGLTLRPHLRHKIGYQRTLNRVLFVRFCDPEQDSAGALAHTGGPQTGGRLVRQGLHGHRRAGRMNRAPRLPATGARRAWRAIHPFLGASSARILRRASTSRG